SLLAEEGLEAWAVHDVWVMAASDANRWVDVTDTFDRGVASLEAHSAYIAGLGWDDFDPREFLEGGARATGQRLGTTFAAAFERFDMGWGS
ncbi:MAG: PIG-L family deacetylase, partial [Aeromicrobium sp.]